MASAQQDPAFCRRLDPTKALADASKAHRFRGSEPTVGFDDLVGRMVAVDLHA
jgi:GDP-D-mannose dehydratase